MNYLDPNDLVKITMCDFPVNTKPANYVFLICRNRAYCFDDRFMGTNEHISVNRTGDPNRIAVAKNRLSSVRIERSIRTPESMLGLDRQSLTVKNSLGS